MQVFTGWSKNKLVPTVDKVASKPVNAASFPSPHKS